MKKWIALACVAVLSTSVSAGFQGGSVNPVKSVAQAKRAYDDTPVVISGYIEKKIDEDTFLFQDITGKIRIDIDDEVWQGIDVRAKEKITIYGHVDKDHGKAKIDVNRIEK